MPELKKLYIIVNSDGSFKGDIFPAFINRVNAEAELQKESGKICLFQEVDEANAEPLPAQNPTLPEPEAHPGQTEEEAHNPPSEPEESQAEADDDDATEYDRLKKKDDVIL